MPPSSLILKHFYTIVFSLACISTFIVMRERTTTTENQQSDFAFNETTDVFPGNGLDFESESNEEGRSVTKFRYPRLYLDNVTSMAGSNDSLHEIYFLGLFELSTKNGKRPEGFSEMAAAELAVRHVNEYELLPGYSLKLLINDTKCDPGVGVDRFFHAIYSKKSIMMLLGSSCSNVTESLANVTPYWNILQVSFGSTSPSLSDRRKFPLFFRTIAPDASHNTARIAFIRHFRWDTVAMLSQSENAFLLPLNDLVRLLESVNVTITAPVTFSLDNYREQLRTLKDSDLRIIIGSFSAQVAPRIFCEVYSLKMYGSEYVWILQDQDTQWWLDSVECSETILKRTVEGLILVSHHNEISENDISISGLTNELFKHELNHGISRYARQTYDAVWAMALTLRLASANSKLSLKEFHYRRQDMVKNFLRRMATLNFMGVSGPVKFVGADRIGNSVFKQVQDGNVHEIAIYNSETEFLDFECRKCRSVIWKREIPISKRILKYRLITVPKSAFIIIVMVSVFGIGVSFIFLYFNLHFRKKKVVKLSSPRLNNVAVSGCVIVYLSVILLGLDYSTLKSDEYFSRLCTVRIYLLSAGFSLAFGSIFAKTYRVNKIFTRIGASVVRNKSLQDKHLIISIFVLLLLDATIVSLWVVTDPLKRYMHNLTIEVNTRDRGVVYQPQVEVCRSNNTSGWFVAIYGYKGCLLIIGVYMAWEARHVKVQALNDSQYIGICVYSAFFSAVIVTLSNFLSEYPTFSYLATTTSILTSTTLTLFLMFLPKLKGVLGRVESEDEIMKSMGLKCEYNTRRLLVEDEGELRYRVEVQNKVYKSELAALDKEIARLEELIKCSSERVANRNAEIYTISNVPAILISGSELSQKFHAFRSKQPSIHEENENVEGLSAFDKIKKLFGSSPTVWTDVGPLGASDMESVDGKPHSDPEVNRRNLKSDTTVNIRCNSLTVVPKEGWQDT